MQPVSTIFQPDIFFHLTIILEPEHAATENDCMEKQPILERYVVWSIIGLKPKHRT